MVTLSIKLILSSICLQQELIAKTLSEYEQIEEFCYCLSDEDMNKK